LVDVERVIRLGFLAGLNREDEDVGSDLRLWAKSNSIFVVALRRESLTAQRVR
jgi:hypothetical protein